ncbi:MAG: DUF3828 domain-containing protein [Pyrinomonadaceae bacterium]
MKRIILTHVVIAVFRAVAARAGVVASGFCLLFLTASFTHVTAQVRDTPESRAKDFYSWYLKAMVKGKDPTKDKAATRSHLSLRFSRWYYSKAGQNLDYDVFVNSQEWDDAWAENIEIGKAILIDDRSAALHVMLRSPPEEFVMKLQVNLVKENGKWKIDRVTGLFE